MEFIGLFIAMLLTVFAIHIISGLVSKVVLFFIGDKD